ncbi:maleate cis-trans isomerase [Streptomyces varsoviensis]|uniref:maleate cis-trans isomerase family protein n=1 Tax=Streptomyces varsoviensis TaxID=67373 RepID=UPI0033EA242E
MWRPDGWNTVLRLGIVTPDVDLNPESEIRAMAPAGIGVHAARARFAVEAHPTVAMPLPAVRAFAAPPHADDAVEQLARAPLDAIAFAFTSTTYLLGAQDDAAMLRRLRERARGTPVVATVTAAVQALHALGARRPCLVHPPWFCGEMDRLAETYYRDAGFRVTGSSVLRTTREWAAVTHEEIYRWVLDHTPDTADAVLIDGNGFRRAVGTIERLEAAVERPVLTANQVLLWAAMRAAAAGTAPAGNSVVPAVTGYGRLFTTDR